MHMWAKEIMHAVKAKVEEIGSENVSKSQLCELKDWTEIAKNLTEYDKNMRIIEAMDEEKPKVIPDDGIRIAF